MCRSTEVTNTGRVTQRKDTFLALADRKLVSRALLTRNQDALFVVWCRISLLAPQKL